MKFKKVVETILKDIKIFLSIIFSPIPMQFIRNDIISLCCRRIVGSYHNTSSVTQNPFPLEKIHSIRERSSLMWFTIASSGELMVGFKRGQKR